MINYKNIIKEFDKKFVRDDGLMDKYDYDDDCDTIPMAESIKSFLLSALSQARTDALKEAVELSDKIETQAMHTELNEWRAFKHFRNELRERIEKMI